MWLRAIWASTDGQTSVWMWRYSASASGRRRTTDAWISGGIVQTVELERSAGGGPLDAPARRGVEQPQRLAEHHSYGSAVPRSPVAGKGRRLVEPPGGGH